MDGKDTDHSFYLLAGKVVNDGRAADLQIFRVREQRVYRNLSRHPYVADVVADILILMRPLRYVEQPFRAAEILEHICQLSEAIKALTLETFRKISENRSFYQCTKKRNYNTNQCQAGSTRYDLSRFVCTG